MTYNDVIKELESVGIEIKYELIEVEDLNGECPDPKAFECQIRKLMTGDCDQE